MELKKTLGLLVLLHACLMVASEGAKKKKAAAPAVYGNTPIHVTNLDEPQMEPLALPPSTASACVGAPKTDPKKPFSSQ